jgi:hypothetical protein
VLSKSERTLSSMPLARVKIWSGAGRDMVI